ncbi:PREDICTED: AAA-ATPase At2g18193-like [Nelumbo nucifera]|uniref:AAA-ATPase At2g18193-like n=1 Tax=Nelumbo nucifera TaxID=4432 RepID=A0A1U8A3W3_NELNU|nr:PREDICTED: AAA-ATPase At2g18193-like [Nelumbo nucifera]
MEAIATLFIHLPRKSSTKLNMYLLSDMPSVSTMLSAYASLAASTMLIRSVANKFIPHQLQDYIFSGLRYLFSPRPSQPTLIFEEFSGITRNQVYEAAELYHQDHPLDRTSKGVQAPREKNLAITIEKGEEVVDAFKGVELKWSFVCSDNERTGSTERYFELRFNKKYREKVLDFYLPFVLNKSKALKKVYGDQSISTHSPV